MGLDSFHCRRYKKRSRRNIKSAIIPPTIPMIVPTETEWVLVEFELA
jgi:hypothetical protein